MSAAIHPVFLFGAIMSAFGFFVSLFLTEADLGDKKAEVDGERMIMAEQTTINARNQPHCDRD